MLLTCNKLTKILPIIRLEIYNNKDISLTVPTKYLNKILILIKNHFNHQFKILTCISGVDYPKNYYRFQIVYEFLSIKFNARLRVKTLVNDLVPVSSIEDIFLSAT
jgi:NADH:ubiquinone oxidoreductase subunit C